MKYQQFEHEFFGLASWMLGCTLRAMGGDVDRSRIPAGDLAFSCLGMMDHCIEMRLLCLEYRRK